MSKKVLVSIEEHLVKTVEVYVPDHIEDEYERMEYAEDLAYEQYKNEEIVLDANDHNKVVLFHVKDVETGEEVDWHNY